MTNYKNIFIFVAFCLININCVNENVTKESFIKNILDKMTLEEKVGQMTQVDKRMLDSDEDIATYFLGSILSGGGAVPKDNTPKGWVKMVNDYQDQALSTRLKIPLIYGIDAVHGHNNVVGATTFPQNIGLGCTNDPDLIKQINYATAVEVAATGLHWTFAPCITIPKDDRWGRQYEGFSESSELVTNLTASAIKGYEEALPTLGGKKIAACAKHFIGDGGTTWDSGTLQEGMHKYRLDRGDTKITEKELREVHLPPYLEAIKAGVKTIMISFNSWNGIKCHGNKFLVNDLLKEELGFEGLVVSDWAGIDEIPGDYKSDIIASINAGIDLVMVPGSLYGQNHYKKFIKLLKESVIEGQITMSRIDDAVTRILRVKYELDLFNDPYGNPEYSKYVGDPKHREIARTAVKKSLVLLKNNSNLLPLNKDQKVYLVGSGANNLGMQNGGWTVEWQGRFTPDFKILDENNDNSIQQSEMVKFYKEVYNLKYDDGSTIGFFSKLDTDKNGKISKTEFQFYEASSPFQPDGTSIYSAIKSLVTDESLLTYDPRANNLNGDGVIVAVIGEYPYAEGYGDDEELSISPFDLAVLNKCYASNKKLIVIMLSGRPLIINKHINNWDSFLAAWLPGMAGEGITDVLYGNYNPTGKLSFSWPKNITQIPIDIMDNNYDPLFEFGFGLSY
jgi:beta-glucosidase